MKRNRSCRFGNQETLVNRLSSDEQLDRRDWAIWMIMERTGALFERQPTRDGPLAIVVSIGRTDPIAVWFRLTIDSFDLDADVPNVSLPAAYSKRRKN